MAKRSHDKKNARRRFAGMPVHERRRRPGQPIKPSPDYEKITLDFMVQLHSAKDLRLPAGWTPPVALCPGCGVSGPYHTAARRWSGQRWESVCPGCDKPLPSPASPAPAAGDGNSPADTAL